MLNSLIFEVMRGLKLFIIMVFLLGFLYTLIVTSVTNIIFPHESQGSLIIKSNKIIGSKLIAQKFIEDKYFWSRPSSINYNPLPSGGSNLALTNIKLKDIGQTNSASGLDPHISPSSAYMQLDRIIKARELDKIKIEKLRELINLHIQKRDWNFLGEEVINILELNIALDKLDE